MSSPVSPLNHLLFPSYLMRARRALKHMALFFPSPLGTGHYEVALYLIEVGVICLSPFPQDSVLLPCPVPRGAFPQSACSNPPSCSCTSGERWHLTGVHIDFPWLVFFTCQNKSTATTWVSSHCLAAFWMWRLCRIQNERPMFSVFLGVRGSVPRAVGVCQLPVAVVPPPTAWADVSLWVWWVWSEVLIRTWEPSRHWAWLFSQRVPSLPPWARFLRWKDAMVFLRDWVIGSHMV